MHGPDSAYPRASFVACSFVSARLEARALPAYPDALPPDLAAAYACQDAAISSWPDAVAGWKVGAIPASLRERYPDERLVGPVFQRSVRPALAGEVIDMPVYVGGFAAVEAEFIFRLRDDPPAGKVAWTAAEAAELVAALHVGVEPASSPLATLNELGPAAIISDFGNNAGLIVGPAIESWQSCDPKTLLSETSIDGLSVGRGSAASIAGGPLAALAFALGCCARRGRPLKAGMHVTTGATTGIHDIRPGQSARVDFSGIGTILCRAVPARPQRPGAALRPNLRAC